MPKYLSKKCLAGMVFGRLTVLSDTNKTRIVQCKCQCGTLKDVDRYSLLSGKTTSCKCYQKEQVAGLIGKASITHGKTNTRVYRVYKNMMRRCYSEKAVNYARYGGRGIYVCKKWRNDFEDFYTWFKTHNPEEDKSLTLERIDNDGPYSPRNCRFATATEQARNTRRTFTIKYKGETLNLYEFQEKYAPHMKIKDLHRRLTAKKPWTMKERLSSAPLKTGKPIGKDTVRKPCKEKKLVWDKEPIRNRRETTQL